jgi:hypothetical protein
MLSLPDASPSRNGAAGELAEACLRFADDVSAGVDVMAVVAGAIDDALIHAPGVTVASDEAHNRGSCGFPAENGTEPLGTCISERAAEMIHEQYLQHGWQLVEALASWDIGTRSLRHYLHLCDEEADTRRLWRKVQLDLEEIALALKRGNLGGEIAKYKGGADATVPSTVLSEREGELLCALLQLHAVGERTAVPRAKASKRADASAKPSASNHSVAALVKRGLVASKKGPNGGIWLTPAGEAAAKALQKKPINRC